MNRFVKSKSLLSVVLTMVCAVALLNDGANLTDLYSTFTTVHFDEVDAASAAQEAVSTLGLPPSLSSFLSHDQHGVISSGRALSSTRVILDQDSPSLPAISISASPTSGLDVEEGSTVHQHVLLAESLYLQNCSLLL